MGHRLHDELVETGPPLQAARVGRLLAVSAAVAVLTVTGALQPFGDRTDEPSEPTTASARAIAHLTAQQEAAGRTCGDTPVLTDSVLFEYAGDGGVAVLTFGQALAATADRAGWVRAYCA